MRKSKQEVNPNTDYFYYKNLYNEVDEKFVELIILAKCYYSNPNQGLMEFAALEKEQLTYLFAYYDKAYNSLINKKLSFKKIPKEPKPPLPELKRIPDLLAANIVIYRKIPYPEASEQFKELLTIAKDFYEANPCQGLNELEELDKDRINYLLAESTIIPHLKNKTISFKEIAGLSIKELEERYSRKWQTVVSNQAANKIYCTIL